MLISVDASYVTFSQNQHLGTFEMKRLCPPDDLAESFPYQY